MHKAFIVLVLAKIRRKKQISKYFAEFLHFRQMELVILVEDLFDCAINQNFVPVLDDMGYFIGIVTRKDIMKYGYSLLKKRKEI